MRHLILAGLLGLVGCSGGGLTADEQLARYNATEAALTGHTDARASSGPLQPTYVAPATPLAVPLLGLASGLLRPPSVVVQPSGMDIQTQILMNQYLIGHMNR